MSDETMTSGTRSSVTTGVHGLPTPSQRLALIVKVQANTRRHKANVSDQRALINATARQIIEECELAEIINRMAWTVETTIDDLVKSHGEAPAFVERNYEQLHKAHDRLAFLLSAMQPRKLQAAE